MKIFFNEIIILERQDQRSKVKKLKAHSQVFNTLKNKIMAAKKKAAKKVAKKKVAKKKVAKKAAKKKKK